MDLFDLDQPWNLDNFDWEPQRLQLRQAGGFCVAPQVRLARGPELVCQTANESDEHSNGTWSATIMLFMFAALSGDKADEGFVLDPSIEQLARCCKVMFVAPCGCYQQPVYRVCFACSICALSLARSAR
jgi:hypothetical protein